MNDNNALNCASKPNKYVIFVTSGYLEGRVISLTSMCF